MDHRWVSYQWLRYVADIAQAEIERGGGRIIINTPPRHGKSQLFSKILPVWFLDRWPRKRVLTTSYSGDLAQAAGKFGRDQFIANPMLKNTIDMTSRASDRWSLTAGGGMRAVGVGGTITGHGADLLMVDDPHKNWAEANSVTMQESIWDWFKSTFYTRADSSHSTVIVIMTRWAVGDLTGRLLADEPGKWKVIRLPAIALEADEMGRPVGQPLCHERFPLEYLEDQRKMLGAPMFEALFQQSPSKPGGEIFRRSWWRYYDVAPAQFDEVLISWDMTFKQTRSGSFVCGQVWGRRGEEYYLLPPYEKRGRWDFVETKHAVVNLANSRPDYRECIVEEKANGAAILSELRQQVGRMIPYNPKGSKAARAQSVAPMMEAGNVFLPSARLWPGVTEYVEEFCTFRGVDGEVNDRVDTTTQALARFRERKNRGLAVAVPLNVMGR